MVERGGVKGGWLSVNRKVACCVREGGKARVKERLTNLPLQSEDNETGVGRY